MAATRWWSRLSRFYVIGVVSLAAMGVGYWWWRSGEPLPATIVTAEPVKHFAPVKNLMHEGASDESLRKLKKMIDDPVGQVTEFFKLKYFSVVDLIIKYGLLGVGCR